LQPGTDLVLTAAALSFKEMETIKQKVTEITVVYKNKQALSERPVIKSADDSFIHILDGYDFDTIGLQEQFVCMYLNSANAVIGVYRSSVGGITGTVADIRLILSVALKIAATDFIISHNHPSGSLKPSRQDVELTAKLKQAASYMDIRVLDHIIVDASRKNYFSFADEGML
jgi:DNA repair protein RadC